MLTVDGARRSVAGCSAVGSDTFVSLFFDFVENVCVTHVLPCT